MVCALRAVLYMLRSTRYALYAGLYALCSTLHTVHYISSTATFVLRYTRCILCAAIMCYAIRAALYALRFTCCALRIGFFVLPPPHCSWRYGLCYNTVRRAQRVEQYIQSAARRAHRGEFQNSVKMLDFLGKTGIFCCFQPKFWLKKRCFWGF